MLAEAKELKTIVPYLFLHNLNIFTNTAVNKNEAKPTYMQINATDDLDPTYPCK